jgi:hypothetical protein
MLGIRVTIVRYISDEPRPGIVECKLEDAYDRQWSFVEKTAIVSAEHLDADTSYPQRGVIAAQMVGRSVDATGRETIRVDTERPWHVESVDGVTQFEVLAESLVEL